MDKVEFRASWGCDVPSPAPRRCSSYGTMMHRWRPRAVCDVGCGVHAPKLTPLWEWNRMSLPLLSDTAPSAPAPQIGALQLFLTFSRITLSGFGGMPFWTRRTLVERQRWLTEREFVELMAIGQLLPGPGTLNLAVMVGQRFAGWVGATAAVAGLLGWPVLIVMALGMLYQRYGALPVVHQALTSMSAVGAGLLLASGIRMAA